MAASDLSFGEALRHLKEGSLVARSGWNGKGMWLKLVRSTDYAVGHVGVAVMSGHAQFKREGGIYEMPFELLPWIGMKTADDKFVPWLASQTDILAEDWAVL